MARGILRTDIALWLTYTKQVVVLMDGQPIERERSLARIEFDKLFGPDATHTAWLCFLAGWTAREGVSGAS